ncbi:NlpC/P60 family protein [Actinomadura sp. B10D3]|uniref:C40 family peptidase n=1 Tax=Actinomadura sp. B10D3 TaxID=3153557 RepID=UPI00325EA148
MNEEDEEYEAGGDAEARRDLESRPGAVRPLSDVDPRVVAALQRNPDVAEILARQSSRTAGPGGAPGAAEALQQGAVNPLEQQRKRDEAARAGDADGAGSGDEDEEEGGFEPPVPSGRRGKGGAAPRLDPAARGEDRRHGGHAPGADGGGRGPRWRVRMAIAGRHPRMRVRPGRSAPDRRRPHPDRVKLRGEAAIKVKPANGGPSSGRKRRSSRFHAPRTPAARKAMVVLPAFGLVVLLLMVAVLGGGMSLAGFQSQPDEKSDAKVAEYIPEGWMKVLKRSTDRAASSGAEDYALVPWTVVGGLVARQTDFARYSPYDNIDRDPGRKVKPMPTAGDGGGGGDDLGPITGGAGPGPIKGIGGDVPGSTATVDASSHPSRAVKPPAGPLRSQFGWFLYALRLHESGGGSGQPNYKAVNPISGACGAYQYLGTTWRGTKRDYMGYQTACQAPPSVQDRRAREDIRKKWNNYHKWQQVAAAHFHPASAASPRVWGRCPKDACAGNPPIWKYVDSIMQKMRDAAERHPAPSTQRSGFRREPGNPASPPAGAQGVAAGAATSGDGAQDGGTGGRGPGVFADGCVVDPPSEPIGGKGRQGTGPYLLSPAAAGQMENDGLDPQSPCDASNFVAKQLVRAARRVHGDPEAPEWNPDGRKKKDLKNARKYWTRVIETSGIFVDRNSNLDAPCTVPPPDGLYQSWSISFKIIFIWRCEADRLSELHLVTGGVYEKGKFKYRVESDRTAAVKTLVNEAVSVSYGAGKWKTEECDDDEDDRQGIFPMTKQEARDAGLADRCDVDKNIATAARLVLSVEKEPPEQRRRDLGPYQPMVGGWQKLGIATGTGMKLFSKIGPGQGSFQPSDACNQVMTEFLTAAGPHASAFAELADKAPEDEDVQARWQPKLEEILRAHGIEEPGGDPACKADARTPGYNSALAQVAVGLSGGAHDANINGLAGYYQARENLNEKTAPIPGKDPLALPRLAPRPLKPVGAPVARDATEAWSRLGSVEDGTFSLGQIAVEYAWFFGGVITPFDSAGKLIGSLASGEGSGDDSVQVTVGPDGCPKDTAANNSRKLFRDGDRKDIKIHKLCVDSVARARTPEAAKAIKWALRHLGIPYCMCPGIRDQANYADCSSFVSKAYRNSGAIPNLYRGASPNTHTLQKVSWMRRIPASKVKPGDLVMPDAGHVAMQLADGYMVHTNRTGDVSKIEFDYPPGEISWAGWVDASRVGK